MKTKLIKTSQKLKQVHRRFLELERQEAEKYFERRLLPFDFLLMMTNDKNFAWLRPFSALIAETDHLVDEAEEVSVSDLQRIQSQIGVMLFNQEGNIGSRYRVHLDHDPEMVLLNAELKEASFNSAV